MKKTNIHIAKIIKEFGIEPTAKNVSYYCYNHYKSITGFSLKSYANQDYFPEEVLEIFSWFDSHYGYDFMVINSYWGV